jgi:hypothetical protein
MMTNWNEMINARPGYVLYIEHDNAPHDVSIHNTLAGAEAALREYAEWVFDDAGEPVVANEDLVEKLVEFNEYARIYKCSVSGDDNDGYWGSVEVEPFIMSYDQDQAA